MDKKKLPQIIIIGLLVAVCAGFCIVKITGNKPDPAPVNKQESTNVKPLDLTADTGEQLTTDGDAPLAVTLNTGTPYPVTKRDPFSPTMDLSER
ncbi:MAG TPA: hypothetical protein PKV43_08755, partial [Armatimonadota bacterium]|nr:hypothetical protein [Armatimonadota bacterium]